MSDAGLKRPGALPVIGINTASANSSASGGSHPGQHSLASLSRNTSVISSSSSSSSTSSLVAPVRPPRPLRNWSQSPSPPGGAGRRARSPHSPTTPRQPYAPPSYLAHQLGFASASLNATSNPNNISNGSAGVLLPPISPTAPIGTSPYGLQPTTQPPNVPGSLDPNRAVTISSSLAGAQARPQIQPRTRTSSAVKKIYSATDFDFGDPLGEGSYSTVRFSKFSV